MFDVGDFLATSRVGLIELLDPGAEEIIGILVVSSKESRFRQFVWLKVSVGMDVRNFGEFPGVATDEYGPVAVKRILFGAHQGDAAFLDTHLEAFQPLLKQWCLSDPVIISAVADVALPFVASGT